MRTLGIALRVLPSDDAGAVEKSFRQTIEAWGTAKQKDPRAAAKGFNFKLARVESRPSANLIEYQSEQAGDQEGRWRTTIRLFQPQSEPAYLTVEMTLEDISERIAPTSYKAQPPRFLRELSKCLVLQSVDGWNIPKSALEVSDPASLGLLADEILDSKRLIPLVVVTDPVYAEPRVASLGPVLADHLVGLARVVHVSRSMTYALSSRLGKELSVFDGGVRIYWPGVDPAASPRRHPLFLRRFMEEAGTDARRAITGAVADQLILVATARYREPTAIRDFLRALEAEARDSSDLSKLALAEQVEAANRQRDEAREYEQIAVSENRRLLVEKEALEIALEEMRREALKWQARHDGLRRKCRGTAEELAPLPEDEQGALEQARKDFAERLLLPQDLHLETDLGAGLYDVFAAMNEAVDRERSRKMGDRQKAFAEIFGKHLNHPARYEPGPTGLTYRVPGGKSEEVRHRVHLKSGKPEDTESVYWLELGDAAKRQYLIVRVGRHA